MRKEERPGGRSNNVYMGRERRKMPHEAFPRSFPRLLYLTGRRGTASSLSQPRPTQRVV